MKVAIYSRGLEEGQEQYLSMLLEELRLKKVSVLLYASLTGNPWSSMLEKFDFQVFTSGADLTIAVDCLISLGGDGTMLDCATLIRDKNIPTTGDQFRSAWIPGKSREGGNKTGC